jgi:hypothetical protein
MWNLIELHEKNADPTYHAVPAPSTISDRPVEFGLFESKEAAEEMISATQQNMSLEPSIENHDPFVTAFIALHEKIQQSAPPPLSIMAQNSFSSAIDIQARLTQHALLSLFFNALNLRRHLNILHRYLLFGNGVFVTRLQEALFEDFDDDDVRSGGQPGLGLGIGMLKANGIWPPNGGKVTLVLRSVLSDCLLETEQSEMSFACRELSDEHFERVKNAIGSFIQGELMKVSKRWISFSYYINRPSHLMR